MALLAALMLALGSRNCVGLTDNILCMPLPRGWSHSVAFGHTPAGSAAWMHAGNFRFSRSAARNEGFPGVPARRVLITIGDFPVFGNWGRKWPRVDRILLPARSVKERAFAWHVRFAGRALYLSVHFGLHPNTRTRALVNRRLATLGRVR
jgi:hypothetical protein